MHSAIVGAICGILKRLSERFSHDGGEPNWYALTEATERAVMEEKGL